MWNAIFSVYVWLVWVLILILFGPIMLLLLRLAPIAWGFGFVKFVSWLALRLAGVQVIARGYENVDWHRPHVFMGNHVNLLDAFVMCVIIPHHMAGVEKVENLQIPIYGWLSRAWGNIPIQRSDQTSSYAGIATAAERLRHGASIMIMPEGTRTRDGRMGPFKKGGFHLALDAHVDIIPFTFNGLYDVLRQGDWKVRPGSVEVVFHPAVPSSGYTKETLDELVLQVREAIRSGLKDPSLA